MSALRSSWSLDEIPLESDGVTSARAASTSIASWCDAVTTYSTQWSLLECDNVLQRASFGVGKFSVLQCQAVAAPEELPQAVSRWWGELPTVVGLLMLWGYLLRQLVRLRRSSKETQTSRSAVVDAFRGLTICVMIFVNYGGGGVVLFLHSAWDGFTVADVVFPCFAWIMGFTMRLASAGRSPTPWRRTLERMVKLFLLGLFLNNGSSWATWRIPGVLQSLAAAYILVTCLTQSVAWILSRQQFREKSFLLAHLLLGVMPLLTINLVLTFGLSVPGCPRGYLGPGGDSDGGLYRHCTSGAHLYVDRVVFGESHIYQTPTCQAVFHTGPFDPEGLLNWLMIAVTTYAGFLGAAFFTEASNDRPTPVKPFFIASNAFFLFSLIVSSGLELVHWTTIPLNKNLWSLSYVSASIAIANLVFGVLLLLLRSESQSTIKTWTTPLVSTWVHVGRNSILIYVLHEILQSYAPFSTKPFEHQTSVVLLLANSAGVLWWIFVAEWLHSLAVIVAV